MVRDITKDVEQHTTVYLEMMVNERETELISRKSHCKTYKKSLHKLNQNAGVHGKNRIQMGSGCGMRDQNNGVRTEK